MTRYARIVLAPTALLLFVLSISGCSKPAASSRQDDQIVKELRKAKTGD